MLDAVQENSARFFLTRGTEESHGFLPLMEGVKVPEGPHEPELEKLSSQGRTCLVGYTCPKITAFIITCIANGTNTGIPNSEYHLSDQDTTWKLESVV